MRTVLIGILLVGLATAAPAQVFNPSTPAGPPPILPPTPPAALPGMNPIPAPVTRDSRTDQTSARPDIAPGRVLGETHNDRSIRCAGQAAALGVPPGSTGTYIRECVNNR